MVCCSFLACKSKKQFTYMKDFQNKHLYENIPVLETQYKINKDDNLYVDVHTMNVEVSSLFNVSTGSGMGAGTQQNFGELPSQYLNGYQVDSNGEINMPVIGKIKVLGETIEEAQKSIEVEVNKFAKDASVKVKLLNYKITVLGEVNAPGVYFNYNSTITILDGISMANGETNYSNLKDVLVVRKTVRGTETYRLNLAKGEELLNSDAYYLKPNDVIYIVPHKNKSLSINIALYTFVMSSVSTLILLLNYFQNQ